jgi:hypothetical protein
VAGSFYAAVPQLKWFGHYSGGFDTVEINCSFYSWPTVAGVQASRRQPRQQDFVYTVKVCELITHVEKFKGTKTLIRDFGIIADILGQPNGMLAFAAAAELPLHQPRLNSIVSQSIRRGATLWNFGTKAGGMRGLPRLPESRDHLLLLQRPRLPDELVKPQSRSMCDRMAPFAGTGTIFPVRNSPCGPSG